MDFDDERLTGEFMDLRELLDNHLTPGGSADDIIKLRMSKNQIAMLIAMIDEVLDHA